MTYWLDIGVDGFYVRDAAYLVEPSDVRQDSPLAVDAAAEVDHSH